MDPLENQLGPNISRERVGLLSSRQGCVSGERASFSSRLPHAASNHAWCESVSVQNLTKTRMALLRLPLQRLCGLRQGELKCLQAAFRPQLVHIHRLQCCSTRLTHSAAQPKITENAGIEQRKAVGQQLREEWSRYSRHSYSVDDISQH